MVLRVANGTGPMEETGVTVGSLAGPLLGVLDGSGPMEGTGVTVGSLAGPVDKNYANR